jgi:hypothetical protein
MKKVAFSLEWEKKMKQYEPDYVYMIPINYKKREVFYESITKVPALVKGAILMDSDVKDNIDLSIYSPSGQIMYSNTINQDIFSFNATEAGSYKIIFDNRYSNTDMKVTFTMNAGQNTILKKEDLSISEQMAESLVEFMKQYSVSYKMKHNAHHERFKSKIFITNLEVRKADSYFYTFSVIETILLVGISIWQFYYIKKIYQTK